MAIERSERLSAGVFIQGQRHPALDTTIRILRNPVGAVSATVILLIVFFAISAEWVTPYHRFETSFGSLESPSLAHPFGTDNIGRDQFTRVIYGARVSLYVGLLAVISGTFTGSLIGLVSGFLGGWFDLVVQRFVDSMLALPGIVLIMAIVSVLGPSTTNALLGISIIIAPATSRVVRSAVLSAKENTYVEAATVVGASNTRIMFRHILPNITAPILILASALLGAAILIEASLSFLGLGTQHPNPSWGLMLSSSGREFMETAPWLAIIPGLAISVTVFAFNMFGDVVRDVLDPRLRGT